jgi:hypothetical protein
MHAASQKCLQENKIDQFIYPKHSTNDDEQHFPLKTLSVEALKHYFPHSTLSEVYYFINKLLILHKKKF